MSQINFPAAVLDSLHQSVYDKKINSSAETMSMKVYYIFYARVYVPLFQGVRCLNIGMAG